MTILRCEDIIELHRLLSSRTGGDGGLRDMGLLESAVYSPYQSFGGEALYPTLTEKAARLGYSLICNHAFTDGNKRIGLLAMLTLLELNGMRLTANDGELTEIIMGVASGEVEYCRLLEFVESNTK